MWDSSTPPKFLGYDTGLAIERSKPIILTSKGYCVELRNYSISGIGSKITYSQGPDRPQNMYSDQWDDIMKNNGWGYAIFFTTANPTANDTPYASYYNYYNINIVNFVIYNPHNGGTYYTVDRNATRPSVTIQGNFKFYDNMGTMRTWNDDYEYFGELWRSSKDYIGETFGFTPLKKIGGYAELGLPNPATTTYPLVYKVK